MKTNNITPNQVPPVLLIPETVTTQNREILQSNLDLEARIVELENELKNQKAISEKGARLMQIIWGDKFQSDSLH
jgi:hypothetical protein